MSTNQSLINTNVAALEDGAELLAILDAEEYTSGFAPAFHSTIGAHFRHVLEHYRCLLSQIGSGLFCYDSRARDQLLECDIDYAERTISELKVALSKIDDGQFESAYSIDDQQVAGSVETSLQRELVFLQSHTIHHYAIIGAMTRTLGKQPETDFGVAIATRAHQQQCPDHNGVNAPAVSESTTCDEVPQCAQ